LGALYLQNSVVLLPERSETVRAVARLLDRLRRSGGTGRSLSITLTDGDEERQVIAQLSAERGDEYQEIVSRVPAFLEEIAYERKRGRATYAEVEESEADLERLRKWLARVKARDYFDAPGRLEAERAVERCAAELAAFEAEAFAAELPSEGAPTTTTKLRAVQDDQP
jgi:Protein ChrB, N-terminal